MRGRRPKPRADDARRGFGKDAGTSFQSEQARLQARKAVVVRARRIGAAQRSAQQEQQKRRDGR